MYSNNVWDVNFVTIIIKVSIIVVESGKLLFVTLCIIVGL